MQTRYLYVLRFILLSTDLFIVNLSFWLSFYFVGIFKNQLSAESYLNYWIVCNLIWMFASASMDAYRSETVKHLITIFRSTWRSLFVHGLMFTVYLLFTRDNPYTYKFLFVFYASMSGLFLVSRFMGTSFEILLKKYFNIRKSVAVLGMNDTGLQLANYFEQNKNNFHFGGFLDDNDSFHVDENGALYPGLKESIKAAADTGVQEIYISISPEKINDIDTVLKEAEDRHVRVKLVPDLSKVLPSIYKAKYMDGFQVLTSRREPLEEIENRFKKRLFDLLFSIGVIIFIFSWLFPFIMVIQYITSPGPVFFLQDRVGRHNKIFKCFKFRTMKVTDQSKASYTPTEKGDSRITKFGAFMRKTSIDELPQFFNVLFGDMSIVGPRPHAIAFNDIYSTMVESIKIRHFVKPGITGWAQLHGLRGDVPDAEENRIRTRNRIEHDIWYLENWDFQLDVKIVFLTFWNMLIGDKNAI